MSSTNPFPDTRSLIDFFNHGTLPFVARGAELERLVGFWQGTAEAQGLRAAVVVGEAGVGKSRLLEELIPNVVTLGGVVVHAKLYPGSSTSIAPIFSRAIRFSGTSRNLLKKDPEEDLESVITALQRLARLRPVLLVVEDVHILSGEALAELTLLLEALSGEAISVLGLARPMDVAARGVMERYLVEEVELEGLREDAIALIWTELFRSPADPEVIRTLRETTLGNSLALRSALRGVLKSGALSIDSMGHWRPAVPIEQFREAIERNIRLLSEGMAAHLSEEEKRTAERLSTLGEVFSREAARVVAAPSEHLIDVLLFKGILVEASSSILPLPGAARAIYPLAFTHTLLHKHLAEHAPVDPDRLVTVVARRLPLYSILPYELLAKSAAPLGSSRQELSDAILHAIECAAEVDRTPDWEMGKEMIAMVEALFKAGQGRWEGEECECLYAKILAGKLNLGRRDEHTPQFLGAVQELLEVTGKPGCRELVELRMIGYKFLLQAIWRTDYEGCRKIWEDAEKLLAESPWIRHGNAYVLFLQTMASIAWAIPDDLMLRRIEERLNEIVAAPETSDELKRHAWKSVAQYFLRLFDSQEELDARLRLLTEVEPMMDGHDITLQTLKIPLYEAIGRTGDLRLAIDTLVPRLRERGLVRNYYQLLMIRELEEFWFDGDGEKILAEVDRIRNEAPEQLIERFDLSTGVRMGRFALLRGEYAFARKTLERFLSDASVMAPHSMIMLAAGEGRLTEMLKEMVNDPPPFPDLVALAHVALGGDEEARGRAIEEAQRTLAYPFLCREDLLTVAAIAELLDVAALNPANEEVSRELAGDLRNLFVQGLEWMAANGFFGVMAPMLARYGRHLGDRELAKWTARAAEIRAAHEGRHEERSRDTRIRVTMLGSIEVHRQEEEPVRPRGARLRTVLGLLVANQMLEKPLTYREFCRLAAGGEDDPERARKMVSMAILRLRESVGSDVINTESETPRLDPVRVQVDLLDAHRLLREARQMARRGALMRALPLLLDAFALTRSEVPFPTLYDDFFEALREDFEYSLREAVIDVGGGLLREGDAASAEEALRRGFEAIPEDEEITQLLCQSLERQGKRVEAGRVRLQATEMV